MPAQFSRGILVIAIMAVSSFLTAADELPAGVTAIALNPGVINTDMLQSCFGGSASAYPSAEQWARKAVPFLLELGPRHNGQSLSVS